LDLYVNAVVIRPSLLQQQPIMGFVAGIFVFWDINGLDVLAAMRSHFNGLCYFVQNNKP
jgi:hypothetical protein